MTKPTGEAEVPEWVELLWVADDAITAKSGAVALDNSELDNVEVDRDVIELSSSDDAAPNHTTKKLATVQVAHCAPSSVTQCD